MYGKNMTGNNDDWKFPGASYSILLGLMGHPVFHIFSALILQSFIENMAKFGGHSYRSR